MSFRLVLLGEHDQRAPEVFGWVLKQFNNHIIHCGYLENRDDYHQWLKWGLLFIIIASQENFGVTVFEAIRFGCLPLFPNRLAYPEIIPKEFRYRVLYDNQKDLVYKLASELQTNVKRKDQLIKRLSLALA